MLGFILIFAWKGITGTLINIVYAPGEFRNENLTTISLEYFSFGP